MKSKDRACCSSSRSTRQVANDVLLIGSHYEAAVKCTDFNSKENRTHTQTHTVPLVEPALVGV